MRSTKALDEESNALQPADGRTVSVSFSTDAVADENLTTTVYHIEADGGNYTAASLETVEDGDTASAETDGFSLYTVEFVYSNKEYILAGGQRVPLSEILSELELVGEVATVFVSAPELFDARQDEDGAWVIYSLQPFRTEEWMQVEIGGTAFTITVTDDTGSVTYVDENGDTQTRNDVSFVTAGDTSWSTGWYAVMENATLDSRVTVTGENKLTIWAQSTGTNKGTLYAGTTDGSDYSCPIDCAGIGGVDEDGKRGGGIITITGGTVEANGGPGGAGIGVGIDEAYGALRLDFSNATDGSLTANSYDCAVTVADADGKPVYVKDENGKIYTGTLTEAEKSAAAGKTLVYAAPTQWQKLQAAIDKADTTATTIKVSAFADEERNVTAVATDKALTVDEGQDITLDLDGCTLDRGLKNKDVVNKGNVITVEGTLTVTDGKGGGTITGNTANRGGGVFVNDAATFALSGAPVIDGNTRDGSVPDDVFLYGNSVITLSDALNCDPIGVTTQRKPGPEEGFVTITSGLREKGGDISWFKSDDEGCALAWNDGGTEAVLGLNTNLNLNYNIFTASFPPCPR